MTAPNTADTIPPVDLTMFSKNGGPLSKDIMLVDGVPRSSAKNCRLAKGTATRVHLPDLAAFAQFIGGLKPNEAIALGVLRENLPNEVTVVTKRRLDDNPGTIARTSGAISYLPGKPALALLDIDVKNLPLDMLDRVEKAGGIISVLKSVTPALTDAAMVIRPSTSSALTNTETSISYPASGGLHVFLYVNDGADAERFLKSLHKRLWLSGYGWLEVGKAGQLLERSLIDRSVALADRLVFEGAPVVHPPLIQGPRVPVVIDGGLLDTHQAVRDLSEVEDARLKELLATERQRVRPLAATVRAGYVEKRIAVIKVQRNCSDLAARRMAEAETAGILLPWAPLEFDSPDLDGCTVADILANPDKFVDEMLADPIEGAAYNGTTCSKVLRRRDGSVFINSLAHGGLRYHLRFDADTISAAITNANAADAVDLLVRMTLMGHVAADEEQTLVALAAKQAGVSVQPIKTRIKKAREDAVNLIVQERRERAAAEASDGRVVLQVPEKDAEHLPVLRALDEVLAAVGVDVPPMRDLDGVPLTVVLREPSSMHALTAAESNAEGDAEHRLPPPKLPLLTRHDRYSLEHEVEQYIRYTATRDEVIVSKALPEVFLNSYMSYKTSVLPRLAAVVSNPLVLADGTLLMDNGLDRQRKVLFMIEPAMREAMPLPHEVNDESVRLAMDYLTKDWLCDVLTDYSGKCVLIAAALTILQRVLFSERPAFIISAGRRGGGKTTATSMIVAAATGARPAAAAWSGDREERRKAAMAAYLEGPACVCWDNIPLGENIACPTLEKMLTAETYTDRLLSRSKMVTVSSTGVMFFTGNNITAAGDMISRSLDCRLETDRPDPENRDFRHADPVEWTLANRHKLIRAMYTILMGNPQIKSPTGKASTRFKTWWRSVGAAVEHAASLAGQTMDFAESFAEGEAQDVETQSLGDVLEALHALTPAKTGYFTAASLKALLEPADFELGQERRAKTEQEQVAEVVRDQAVETVRSYFATRSGEKPSSSSSAVWVSARLRTMVGNAVRVGDYNISLRKAADKHANINTYSVRRTPVEPTAEELEAMLA